MSSVSEEFAPSEDNSGIRWLTDEEKAEMFNRLRANTVEDEDMSDLERGAIDADEELDWQAREELKEAGIILDPYDLRNPRDLLGRESS